MTSHPVSTTGHRIDAADVEWPQLIAAAAALARRYTDRTQLVVAYGPAGSHGASAVELDLAGDQSFGELATRAGQLIAREQPRSNGGRYDVVIERLHGRLRVSVGGAENSGAAGEEVLGHLQTMLASGLANPQQPIDALPILTEPERQRLLHEWNRTAAEYPQRCLHELVAEQAARTPDAVAVQCGGQALSYAELLGRAGALASYLRGRGVGPGVLVGICVERSVEMVVGLLGILGAGGAYVPIDPTYPPARQRYMLESSQAPVVVTEERLVSELPTEGVANVCLDRDWDAISRAGSALPPGGTVPAALDPEQLAYVIYTSGSTGAPKGVEIPHRALVNFLWSMRDRPGLSADDVLVAVTTLSFDIAGLELYLPLVVGARVVIAPAQTAADPGQLAALLADTAATVMQATPTTWRMLLDSGWRPGRALRALCGGEPLPVALADRLLDAGVELWNMYGPTETTIWSTCTRVSTRGQMLTIGRPIANTSVYLLDKRLEPVPVGVAGELWIAGDGVAAGYRGRPDMTAERFVTDRFAGRAGARMYRTGDLARYRPDGEIEFLGRIDHQVKVRGFRIELGEIETVLARHPAVAEAVVVARGDTTSEAELAAYVIPYGPPAAAYKLREFAALSLPSYMVPSTVTTLDSFPLTPNGKVDRKALPEPSRERGAKRELVQPRTELERRLQEIWERELHVRPIGVTDDFFDLGVTSLVAASLFAAIEHELGNRLPLGAIFRAPTIEGLARLLETGAESSRWTSLVPIQPSGTQQPIFCVHGGAGTILNLQELARSLGDDQPFYGLQSRGLYGGATPLKTVEEMASHYLDEMRQVHPGGPWRICGYCFGALVAFEIAQRLVAAGETVELLAVFNGPSPDWIRAWGWYGNQPSKRGAAPGPAAAAQRVEHRHPRVRRVLTLLSRVPRLIREPHRILNSVAWYTRRPRTRVLLALGRPVAELHREDFFLHLHVAAERAYYPTPYPGEMLVFYGSGLYEDPTLGWEGMALGGLRTFAAPGEHGGNRRMMREPAVGWVAERLREYLVSSG